MRNCKTCEYMKQGPSFNICVMNPPTANGYPQVLSGGGCGQWEVSQKVLRICTSLMILKGTPAYSGCLGLPDGVVEFCGPEYLEGCLDYLEGKRDSLPTIEKTGIRWGLT